MGSVYGQCTYSSCWPKISFAKLCKQSKTHHPDLLVRDHLNQEDFEYILKGLRHRMRYLEGYSFCIHWFSTENRLKVIMPPYLHKCVGAWILKTIASASSCGLLPNSWDDTMDMMDAPECQNFIGQHAGSFKEPDMAFVSCIGPGRTKCVAFPSVVVESGWQESTTHHFDDNIFPTPPNPQQDPAISLKEFYANDCPSTMNPEMEVPLDLAILCNVVTVYIRDCDCVPA
ncbi:hypothetical protein HOY80DRAFT_1035957 [Tuber brumale]|nr:hypothetical protein HOY80DRAFT_1035957 [Tuber brumale]